MDSLTREVLLFLLGREQKRAMTEAIQSCGIDGAAMVGWMDVMDIEDKAQRLREWQPMYSFGTDTTEDGTCIVVMRKDIDGVMTIVGEIWDEGIKRV